MVIGAIVATCIAVGFAVFKLRRPQGYIKQLKHNRIDSGLLCQRLSGRKFMNRRL